MQVAIELPDDIAGELAPRNGVELPRVVLESVALEGYRSGRLTHAQAGRLLGLDYRLEIDAFLKEHGAALPYDLNHLESDRDALGGLGVG